MTTDKLNQIRADLKARNTLDQIAVRNSVSDAVIFAIDAHDTFGIVSPLLSDEVLAEKLDLIQENMKSNQIYRILRN